MAVSVFLDTSVLLAGLIDLGPQSAPAQSLLHAVAEKNIPSPARPGIAARVPLGCDAPASRVQAAAGRRDPSAGGRSQRPDDRS